MRAAAVIVVTALALAACGVEAEKAAPTPAPAAPAIRAADIASPATPVILSDTERRRVCVAGMAAVHGQAIDAAGFDGETVGAIRVDASRAEVVSISWPAPVDGGRRFADCRIEGDMIQWRPARLRSGETAAWMTGPEDPVIRFTVEGGQIAVTQSFSDGTTSQTGPSSVAVRGQG